MAGGPAAKDTAQRLFSGLARSYDRVVDVATCFQDRYWKQWVARHVPDREGGLALDLGCGTLLTEERMGAWKLRFVGVDLSEEMLREGRAKALSNMALMLRGDAEELPFHSGTFDVVISCYVAKYVGVGRFAEEIARVAKEGATVVVYDFVKPSGPFAPLVEAYIQAGLRAAGFLLRLAGRGSAFTFTRLPGIVEGTVWEKGLVRAMEREGFETKAAVRLTGGVVSAYCGRRRASPYSQAATEPQQT